MNRRLSVRARLAVSVGVLTAATLSIVAVFAPSVVEDSLRSDLLDSEAESALAFVTFDVDDGAFGSEFVISETGEIIEVTTIDDLSEFGLDEFPIVSADFGELAEAQVGQQISLLRAVDQLDELISASGGAFAVSTPAIIDGYAVVSAEGVVSTGTGSIYELDIPVIPTIELDELIFDDLAILETAPGSFVNTSEDVNLITGITEIEGTRVLVAADASSVDRSVQRVRSALWLGVPILTLLVAAVAWLLASRSLRPVRSITEQAATISGGTLDSRVPVPATGDEIATLATTVNEMLDRLEDDDHRRRRFISDASHELRSPVAVMRNEAEVALAHPERADAGDLAAAVSAESARLATIIDDLLALARHDEGVPAPANEVDLDDIVLAEAARARRVSVDTKHVSAGRVNGRSDELARMVGHLLDNAARHADHAVAVSLQTENGEVVLSVDDDGPGVSIADRERVFERFGRLDEARSRDHGGAGLGLAVVAGIAERSGGRALIEDSHLGGARFIVRLPA